MRSILHVAFVCVLWLLAGATPYAQAGSNFAGESCPRGVTDPMKCMVCTLYFEARPDSYRGMLEVGRVIMERVESESYPGNICSVVYSRNRRTGDRAFTGLPNGAMSRDPEVMERVVRAARAAMVAGGNGFLGFRACGNRTNNVGGNCFRVTGDSGETMPDNLRVEQASWNSTSPAEAELMVDTILYRPASRPAASTFDSSGTDAAL